MANGLGETLLTSLRAFGGRRSFGEQTELQDTVRQNQLTRQLLERLSQAPAAQRGPVLEQLAATNPQVGAQAISNFGQLDEQRQRAMFQDAFAVRQRLDNDPQGALEILDRRLSAGTQLGGDMSDTQEIRDLIASGNLDEAREELDTFIRFGQQTGMLEGAAPKVQRSEVLPDGSVLQVMNDQSTRFLDPSGNVLTGKDRADAIKAARSFGADVQGERERKRQQQRQSQEIAREAFDRIGPIRTSIENLDDVIRVIDEGAQTGVIASKLPSVRAASIELDNLRNRMGLDVIGGTTFGALSESELAFALDTALPDNLQPDALRDWVTRKQEAQRKVLTALQDQARFFSRGGTIDELLDRQAKEAERTGAGEVSADVTVEDTPGTSSVGRFQIEVVN